MKTDHIEQYGTVSWKLLFNVGGIAALLAVFIFRRNLGAELMLLRGLFPAVPATLPVDAAGWFALLQQHPFVGLTLLEVFDLVEYALVGAVFLAVCGFGAMFCGPITIAAHQAIWQAKVAPELQGRVFAFRRAISMSTGIVAPLLAAPLADYIFKPAMAPGGALVPVLGPIIGVGAGRGIGVLISLVGLLIITTTLIALSIPQLRRVEVDLPDHDPALKAAPETKPAE